jgi:AP2 domain
MHKKRGFYRMPRHPVTQPLDQSIRLIPLTRGQCAIVDAIDFEWLNQWNWWAQWNPHTKSFYAVRNAFRSDKRPGTIYMGREILKIKENQIADHINHDTLNHRRNNLRGCSHAQNSFNTRPRGKSGFKGVTPNGKKWQAHIRREGCLKHLGSFITREEAARAYDKAAKELHGEFAHLNFG